MRTLVRRTRFPTTATLLILWGGLFICSQPHLLPTDQQHQEQQVVTLLVMQRSRIPLDVPETLVATGDEDPWHLALAAEAAASGTDDATAIELYERLPSDGGRWEFIAQRGLGLRALAESRLADAERHLRRAVELNPADVLLLDRLGHLLQVEGRAWEAAPFFYEAIIRGYCQGDQLVAAAGSDRFFRRDEGLELACLRRDPVDPMMQLAMARRLARDTKPAEAERLFKEVGAAEPDCGEAQGRLGRIIVDRGDLTEFLLWRGGLSDKARRHPEVWYVQGLKARRDGMTDSAVRCFLEAAALDPNHVGTHVQIAPCLEQLGYGEAAELFQQRGRLLAELESVLNIARADTDPKSFFRLADLCSQLGRQWEAAGWASRLEYLQIERSIAKATFRPHLEAAFGRWEKQNPSVLPSRLLDLDEFPLPHWSLPERVTTPTMRGPLSPSTTPWSFVEESRSRGIDFTYFEGTDEENRLEHIFNVMGGGLAATDYDLDGWPDLYVAQANQWRDPQLQPEYFDRLFRNRGGERFSDFTRPARLGDLRFSHGVTAGDFDQDGFPDLYVGNLEPNRLYHNQGDGTYREITLESGVGGDEWTTSSVFADFNQDALPDLYVLNYTLRHETAQRECGTPDDRAACTPDLLTAEDHRCYVNRGDGTFRDVSRSCGILGEPGKGLGVVAWDYANNGRIGLYIANDTTPDFFFVNHGVGSDGVPQFTNEGVVRGIAYDVDGNPQASMGVAAGDVTGDGLIDILITDFFESGNAMYSQGPDGFFEDVSREYNIHQPSLTMLGFGCHFADLDGDGWLDLIVTNGHVDQTTARGGPDRMPPQVYRNVDGQRFEVVSPEDLGHFFQTGFLGRGLAILDWNRDGRTDAAISHLHAPLALVTNHTPSENKRLTIRLVAQSGCREPTGASVRLLNVEPLQVRLQTAGDGFLVTNERRHQFAVPPDAEQVAVEVRWPNGAIEVFEELPAEGEMLLIEGTERAMPLQSVSQTR